jgi:hypothetical protein
MKLFSINKKNGIKSFRVMTLISVVLLFFSFNTKPDSPEMFFCDLENTSFKSGEKLVYTAYYNWEFVWVPAGEAVFEIKETNSHYEIKVTGRTYSSYDYFFRVRDYFYSKIDKKTLLPNNFVRIVEEGDYRKFDSLVFNHNTKKAVSFNGKSRKTAEKKVIPFEQCTHDLLSVLYFMRNVNVGDFKPGQQIPVKMLFDEEIYPIKVRYTGKDPKVNIKGLGTYNTVTVVPDLVTGSVFKDGNKMKVWVSDDYNKIPLLIESPLKMGTAKAILKSYSGHRHPMSSKIN